MNARMRRGIGTVVLVGTAVGMAVLIRASGAPIRHQAVMSVGDRLPQDVAARLTTRGVLGAAGSRASILMFADSACVHCVAELRRWEVSAVDRSALMSSMKLVIISRSGSRYLRALVPSLSVSPIDDPDGWFGARMGVNATPTTFYIDRNGVVRARVVGEAKSAAVEHAIRLAIAGGRDGSAALP